MGIATEGGAAGDSDGDGHGWEAAGAWISDAAARSGTTWMEQRWRGQGNGGGV